MPIPSQKYSSCKSIRGGLVVIARDAAGQIVTRITSNRDLVGAMDTACSVLRLKLEAIRVEVYQWESSTSEYRGKPLTALSHDDLPAAQHCV